MKLTSLYKGGTKVSYTDFGNKNGYPILIQHGLIASITDSSLFSPLLESGLRLICIARPGYGESSNYLLKNLGEWGEIVAAVVDDLQLAEFDVFGISSGAPYGYSVAHRFPSKVRRIFILSGVPALYSEQVRAWWPFDINAQASLADLQILARELFFSDLSREDLEREDIKDSMMNDCYGVAQDLLLRGIDWGFNLAEVPQEVFMRHSRSDTNVPFITAEITARLLPHCHLEVRDNDVHFSEDVLNDFIKKTIIPLAKS